MACREFGLRDEDSFAHSDEDLTARSDLPVLTRLRLPFLKRSRLFILTTILLFLSKTLHVLSITIRFLISFVSNSLAKTLLPILSILPLAHLLIVVGKVPGLAGVRMFPIVECTSVVSKREWIIRVEVEVALDLALWKINVHWNNFATFLREFEFGMNSEPSKDCQMLLQSEKV